MGRRRSSASWKFFKGSELVRGDLVWAVYLKYPKWPCIVSSASKDTVRVVWLPFDHRQTRGFRAKLIDRFTKDDIKEPCPKTLDKSDTLLFGKSMRTAEYLLGLDIDRRLDAWTEGVKCKTPIDLGLDKPMKKWKKDKSSEEMSSPSLNEEACRSPTPISSPSPNVSPPPKSRKKAKAKKRARSLTPEPVETFEERKIIDVSDMGDVKMDESYDNNTSKEDSVLVDSQSHSPVEKEIRVTPEPANQVPPPLAMSSPKTPGLIQPKHDAVIIKKKPPQVKKVMKVKLKSPKSHIDIKGKSNEKFLKNLKDKMAHKVSKQEGDKIICRQDQDDFYAKICGKKLKVDDCVQWNKDESGNVASASLGGSWKPLIPKMKDPAQEVQESPNKVEEAVNKSVQAITDQGEEFDGLPDSPRSPSPAPCPAPCPCPGSCNVHHTVPVSPGPSRSIDAVLDQIDVVERVQINPESNTSPTSSNAQFPSIAKIKSLPGSPEKQLPSVYTKGQIIWAKYRKDPYWPAIVTGFNLKTKNVSYEFLPLRNDFEADNRSPTKKFKSSIKLVLPFMENYDVHSSSNTDPDFAVGLKQAKDICNNVMDPYNRAPKIEKDMVLKEEVVLSPSKKPLKKRPTKFVSIDDEEENDDSEEDAVSDQEDNQKSIHASIKKSNAFSDIDRKREARMKKNEELLNFITKNPLCKEHLLKIYAGTVPSKLHKQWKNRDGGLMVRYSFGPICDEKQIDALFDVLSTWYAMVPCADIRVSMIWTYVGCVWIPEAVKFGLMHTRNVNEEEAEKILHQPPDFFEEELADGRKDYAFATKPFSRGNEAAVDDQANHQDYQIGNLNSSHLELLAEAAAAMQEEMQPSTSHMP